MGLGFNYSALEIIPDPILTEEKHSAYNTCPLYKVDSIYGVKKRNPMGNLRPPAWRYKHGLAIDADPTCCSIAEKSPSINRTVCCYCPMERPDCPTSGITKVAEIFDVNYNQGQVLEPVQDQMAWASVFPDYFDDSLSGILLLPTNLTILSSSFISSCIFSCSLLSCSWQDPSLCRHHGRGGCCSASFISSCIVSIKEFSLGGGSSCNVLHHRLLFGGMSMLSYVLLLLHALS